MKKIKITLFLLALLTLLIFSVINKMTVSPGTSSGNGNPALLIAFILIPIFFIMVVLWVSIFKAYAIRRKILISFIVLTATHVVVAFIYQRKELEEYREVIKNALIKKNGFVNLQYVHDITSGITIHVNNQYFNLSTFFLFLTSTIFVASIYQLSILLEKNNEFEKTSK
ncbi:hypothetical protein [Sporosarcina sp. HYO08]|uniref:hypothetical protein n=1 Tax=Sporosarcina sp. HYO08 TaxID=1759557 RepID=UPI000799DB49|nr:hypothetical protein [Sporosarcina sp. HYO08]KXH87247.1 hypothetical protein AU377_01355 [Sporosarcina sp. HYO08]